MRDESFARSGDWRGADVPRHVRVVTAVPDSMRRAIVCMRHADRIRVPKALRGPALTAGRQGRRRCRSLRDHSSKSVNQLDALGGSTWLVPLSLLALSHC